MIPLLPLLLLSACSDPRCVGAECDFVPDVPWEPDADDTGGGYGYGDADDDTEVPVETGDSPEPIVTVRDCDEVVSTTPGGSPSTVQIAGEWSGWALQDLIRDGESWSITLEDLGRSPGEYAYKFVEDGSWEGDPPAWAYSKWVDGTENRNLRVGDCTLPKLQVVEAETGEDGTLHAVLQLASGVDGAPLDPDSVSVTVGGEEVSADIDATQGTITVDLSGLQDGKHSLRVWAADTSGQRAENEPVWVPLWVQGQDWTWDDATLYLIFTDRFRNGDYGDDLYDPVSGLAECSNWNGGDYLGVLHAMDEDYFEALGVNALWLSPVYQNPEGSYLGTDGTNYYTGYHGYWPIAAQDVESRYGDTEGSDASERLKQVIDEAHARGIRVVFDLVLNHVHEDHEYLDEHPEWFDLDGGCVCGTSGCGWEEKPVECWFTDYLPDLNYKEHELLMRVVDDTLEFVQTYDVDGLRVDAAKHMDHVIMRTLSMRVRDEVERIGGAEFYLVGETFTSDRDTIMDYVGETELDGQFDFPLYYAIRTAFIDGGSFRDLESAWQAGVDSYGDARMSPFLGNHDVTRFASEVSGETGDCWVGDEDDPMNDGGTSVTRWDIINTTSLAFAFLLTQPGVPLLYYGDEIGLHGGGDPDNRRIMHFDPYLSANQETLRDRVRALGAARQDIEALRRGDRQQLWVDDDLYVIARDNGGGDVAIVAMNKGGSTRTESVDVSAYGLEGETLSDALGSGESATVIGGELSLSLDSMQYLILVP